MSRKLQVSVEHLDRRSAVQKDGTQRDTSCGVTECWTSIQ